MSKLENLDVSLEKMLHEEVKLTAEAKKEAEISVLMDEIDKLKYTDAELKEGLEIFKELLDGIKENEEVNNYLKDLPDGNFHKVNQIQEWLESYYDILVNNKAITAAARDEDDRRAEYTKFLKGFRLLGEVMRKKELDPIQLVGNLCTIADLNGVCASGWKYTLIELITRYKDDIKVKGIMDGIEKLEYSNEDLKDVLESFKEKLEQIKQDKDVQDYLRDFDNPQYIDIVEDNINGICEKLINNELNPKLAQDNKEKYNKTMLTGLKLYSEYMNKKDLKPLDVMKDLIKISELNIGTNEEKTRETIANLLTQFPDEMNKNIWSEMKISEETNKIKVRLDVVFFEVRESITKKLCYDLLNKLDIEVSYRPHYMDIYKKYLNREYGLNLPELALKDSFIEEGSEEYKDIENEFAEYIKDIDLDRLIFDGVCEKYNEILNETSKIRQEARDEVTDWATLYINRNDLKGIGEGKVEDTSDFLMEYGYDDMLINVRKKLIEEVLEDNGYVNREYKNKELSSKETEERMLKAINYCEKDAELERVKQDIKDMLSQNIINKEAVINALIRQENRFNEKEVLELIDHDLNNPRYAYLALYMSVINNKTELVKSLINKGINLNITVNGHSLMFFAISNGHTEMAKLLIQNGLKVNMEITNDANLIINAIKHDNLDMVKFLIEHGPDVNKEISNGQTPIMVVANKGDKQMAKLLIEHGADLNKQDINGQTPMIIAVNNGNVEMAKLLIENGADLNKGRNNGATPIIIAAGKGDIEMTKLLIEHGADLNMAMVNGQTPIMTAINKLDIEMTKLLIEHGADLNKEMANGITPVILVADKGNKEMAKLLIEHGADLNKQTNDGVTPALIAAQNGDIEMAKLLIENGTDLNKQTNNGATPVLMATKNGDKEMVKLLIEHGADINKAMRNGNTPIIIAINNGDMEMTKLLIENGTDISKVDMTDVVMTGNKDIIELFIDKGADISKVDMTNVVMTGNKDIIELFIAKGADMSTVNMTSVVKTGNKELIEFCVDKGADMRRVNMIVAVQKEDMDLIKFCIDKGADLTKLYINDIVLEILSDKLTINDVEFLIKNGLDVSELNSITMNFMVKISATEEMELFLKNGVDINKVDMNMAVNEGNKEMIELLVNNGANVKDIKIDDKMSPEIAQIIKTAQEKQNKELSQSKVVGKEDIVNLKRANQDERQKEIQSLRDVSSDTTRVGISHENVSTNNRQLSRERGDNLPKSKRNSDVERSM